jgi:hypothetical protein
MIHVHSPLDGATEMLISRIIGCAIAVHKELDPGLLESIYRRALCIELAAAGLSFEVERQIPVMYRGVLLCHLLMNFNTAILPDGLKRIVMSLFPFRGVVFSWLDSQVVFS